MKTVAWMFVGLFTLIAIYVDPEAGNAAVATALGVILLHILDMLDP